MASDMSLGLKSTNAASATGHSADARIEIREVRCRRDLREFVRFPLSLYQHDANWVAPLEAEVIPFLDARSHPFYRHGEAAHFVAERDGRTVGRILVSDDPRFNTEHGTNAGCFGMFESVDDLQVSRRLLDTAAKWLQMRGRAEIMGPIDYSTNYACGLLVDGFEAPPRIMMNHHPPYYARLLESWGLKKAKDLYAWWFVDQHNIINKWQHRMARIAERNAITVRPLRWREFDQEVDRCRAIYNQAWSGNWGFVRMTDAEFKHLSRQIKRFGVPDLTLMAEVKGQPVGLSVTLPDWNEAIKPLRGRLSNWGLPIGLARLAIGRRHIKTARMAVLGVLEEYRCRGVSELLIFETIRQGMHIRHFSAAELGWTLEDNALINRAIERVGGRRYKVYRIFTKRLGPR